MADSQYFKDRYHPRYHGKSVPVTDLVIVGVMVISVGIFSTMAYSAWTAPKPAKTDPQKVCYSYQLEI